MSTSVETVRNARKLLCAYREKQERFLRNKRSGALYRDDKHVLTKEDQEYAMANFVGSYTKGLDTSAAPGLKENYIRLAKAISNGDAEAMALVKTNHPLDDPLASTIYCNLIGANRNAVLLPPPPGAGSEIRAYEMAELYAMSVLRDVPLSAYDQSQSNTLVLSTIQRLTAIPNILTVLQRKVNPKVADFTPLKLFRGIFDGPMNTTSFLSGFWEKMVNTPWARTDSDGLKVLSPSGIVYSRPAAATNYLKTAEAAIEHQTTPHSDVFSGPFDNFGVPNTLRDLAYIVKSETTISIFTRAAAVLDTANKRRKVGASDDVYAKSVVPVASNLSDMDVYAAMGELHRIALQSAWDEKWRKYRTLRPEAYGIIVNSEVTKAIPLNNGAFVIPSSIRKNVAFVDLINYVNENINPGAVNEAGILSQCYPNGCDYSPSYPSEVAVSAGALATLLKAKYVVDDKDVFTDDKYGTTAQEINKLAWNIAVGQCAAGVNYQSDIIDGISFGERLAVEYLRDLLSVSRPREAGDTCVKSQIAVSFPSFVGSQIKIVPVPIGDEVSNRYVKIVVAVVCVSLAAIILVLAGAMLSKYGLFPKYNGWFYKQ